MNVLLAALLAFVSAEWSGRREMLTREAERLQIAYTNCAAQATEPAEGVVVPVEVNQDGSVKLSIEAKKAQLFLDRNDKNKNLVWAEGVVIRKTGPDGAEMSRIEADSCVFDRNTKSGWADGTLTMTHGGTVFTGHGVYFSSMEDYVMSFSGSSIYSKDLKFGGGL